MSASKKRASAPWKRPPPARVGRRKATKLSPVSKKRARERARRAGRSYPNLVDNMREASRTKKATSRRKSKRSSRSKAGRTRAPTRDPKGGLTAAGRAAFKARDGAQLKPGVKKPVSAMTSSEMRRKGSWAARFYGRAGKLPALRDADGKPTRFALTAAAWGEPVPRTERAARAIAAKGRRLLERAKRARVSRSSRG